MALTLVLTSALALGSCHTGPPDRAEEIKEFGGGYYHLSQGSELFPYKFFPILERADSEKLFSEDLERFGLIPDPKSEQNPLGLPVGLSVAHHQGSPMAMIGMTCSACHSGRIEYEGESRDLMGAPSMFDADRFFDELADAAEATLHDREKRLRLLKRYLGKETALGRFLSSFHNSKVMEATGHFEDALLDEIERVISSEVKKAQQHLDADQDSGRHDLLVKSDEESAESLQIEDYSEALESNESLVKAHDHKPLSPPSADFKRPKVSHIGQDLENIAADIRLMAASIRFLRNYSIVRNRPTSLPGNGRVDAFGKVRNMVVPLMYGPEVERPTTAPVSYPHLWGTRDARWLHWNSNTDSVMERNVLEALGSGAIVDLEKYDTTVNFENLFELESMTHDFVAPVWPEDLLPPVDAALAERGRKIFFAELPEFEDTSMGNCVKCHNSPDVPVVRDLKEYPQYSLDALGTDPNHAENFNRPLDGGHGAFPENLKTLAEAVTQRYYTENNISEETQALWEDHRKPVVWRSPIDEPLASRPLDGTWATAPFLHNGSVPTLYDLLLPAEERPRKFMVGTHRFDPVKVGYETDAPDAISLFDVDAKVVDGSGKEYPEIANGNSNAGHEFGTALSDEDRWALVEFLKTL